MTAARRPSGRRRRGARLRAALGGYAWPSARPPTLKPLEDSPRRRARTSSSRAPEPPAPRRSRTRAFPCRDLRRRRRPNGASSSLEARRLLSARRRLAAVEALLPSEERGGVRQVFRRRTTAGAGGAGRSADRRRQHGTLGAMRRFFRLKLIGDRLRVVQIAVFLGLGAGREGFQKLVLPPGNWDRTAGRSGNRCGEGSRGGHRGSRASACPSARRP